eukprot:2898370-Rhodomonas_salina.4
MLVGAWPSSVPDIAQDAHRQLATSYVASKTILRPHSWYNRARVSGHPEIKYKKTLYAGHPYRARRPIAYR